jgi:hypothetical protein
LNNKDGHENSFYQLKLFDAIEFVKNGSIRKRSFAMYLDYLNKQQKHAFLEIALYTVSIDNEVCQSERDMLQVISNEMNIFLKDGEFSIEASFDLEKRLEVFDTDEAKRILLLETLTLIFIDKKLHENEEELLQKIARHYNFNDKFLDKCLEYAKQTTENFYLGRELIFQ